VEKEKGRKRRRGKRLEIESRVVANREMEGDQSRKSGKGR
jgi:hypothetical protein